MFVRVVALSSVLFALLVTSPAGMSGEFALKPAIVFVSTRDAPTIDPNAAAEIYLMSSDGTDPVRLTRTPTGMPSRLCPLFGNWGELRVRVTP